MSDGLLQKGMLGTKPLTFTHTLIFFASAVTKTRGLCMRAPVCVSIVIQKSSLNDKV